MALRLAVITIALAGCIMRAQQAISPPAAGGGTLSCREIVEQCDSQCNDPLCVRRCGDQGTPEAAQLHNAVVDCAQSNGCMDEACIRSSCGPQADACQGPPAAEPAAN